MRRRGAGIVGTVVLLTLCGGDPNAAAGQWPQFRGPQAGVVADDPALPDRWSTAENVVWATAVPGLGWSSPIVWNDQIFVTSVISSGASTPPKPGLYAGTLLYDSKAPHRWMVYAVDFVTGKIRWQRELRNIVPPGPKHLKNSFASETPVTDGERLYVYFAGIGLFALRMTGEVVWSREMPSAKVRGGWGTGASPALLGDRLYVVNDNDTGSFIAAFDKRTGNDLWRVNRDEGSNWATPFVWKHDLRTEIVTAGTDKVRSYDLDGTLLWELTGMTWITIPTPFASDGLLYLTAGYPGDLLRPVYAIRPGASGDISLKDGETSNAYIAWFHNQLGPYHPSPLVYQGRYYTLFDRGFLSSHEAGTGKQIYGRQRISADASGFTASPWAYNDKIFALSEDGDTYVIQAGSEFKLLGKNSLNDMTLATPAIARGSVIIRTQSTLYRIAKSGRP